MCFLPQAYLAGLIQWCWRTVEPRQSFSLVTEFFQSPGSLLVVLLLRTAHHNLSKLKDVYLHTNTLAALANLAPNMSNLSSHAAQRLMSLFDMLSKRCDPICYPATRLYSPRWARKGRLMIVRVKGLALLYCPLLSSSFPCSKQPVQCGVDRPISLDL